MGYGRGLSKDVNFQGIEYLTNLQDLEIDADELSQYSELGDEGCEMALDLNLSNRMYCGGEFSIKAYSSEEEVVYSFIIMDSSLISTSGGSYHSTGNNTTKQYVEELYNKYYVPEAKEG